MPTDNPGAKLTGGAISVLLLVIILSLAAIIGGALVDTGESETETRDHRVLLDDAGEFVEVNDDDGIGENETVLNSRGNSLQFTGANDSYLEGEAPFNASGNWSVSQGVWIDDDATGEEVTLVAVGDPTVILRYQPDVGGEQAWQAVIVMPFSTHVANVSATDPTNATLVQVVRVNDTVTIYEQHDGAETEGESADLSSESDVSFNATTASNCACRLDETRSFDVALDQSTRQGLESNPVRPVDPTPLARVYYDELDGSSVYVYHADVRSTASNATLADGFAGEEMDPDGILFDNDYAWRDSGPQIRPSVDGRLDGAPVAFVEYDFTEDAFVTPLQRHGGTAITLFAVALILIPAVAAVAYMRGRLPEELLGVDRGFK